MSPLIYLDTQDYIKAFNEPESGANRKAILELAALRESGNVRIGYSFVTMVEFITKPDAENRSERVRRGALVKQVCGNNAFPPIHELAKGARFPNNGYWFSGPNEKMISATNFRRTLNHLWKSNVSLARDLNRKDRRKLARKASMSQAIRSMGETWGTRRSDWGDVPVSEEILRSKLLQRFMTGQCSDDEFEKQVNAWVFDPAEFSRIVYDYADHPNVIEKYFGEQVSQVAEAVSQMQSAVASIREENK